MTPADFKAIRHQLGLGVNAMARALGLTGADVGRTVRRFERGEIVISRATALRARTLLVVHDCPRCSKAVAALEDIDK